MCRHCSEVWGQVQPSLNMNEKGEAGNCRRIFISFPWLVPPGTFTLGISVAFWKASFDGTPLMMKEARPCFMFWHGDWPWLEYFSYLFIDCVFCILLSHCQGPVRAKSLTKVGIYWPIWLPCFAMCFTLVRCASGWKFCSHEPCAPKNLFHLTWCPTSQIMWTGLNVHRDQVWNLYKICGIYWESLGSLDVLLPFASTIHRFLILL